jgi:PAS domain S-box-containing protein
MADSSSRYVELIERLFRLTNNGFCVVSRRGRCVRANPAFAAVAARAVEDLLGTPVEELLAGPAGREFAEVVTKVLDTEEPVTEVELRGRDMDGTAPDQAWMLSVHPLHSGGELTGAIASFHDISHLRRAEEVVQQQLREIDTLYRNAPVGLSYTDTELRYLRVNQAIADLNGVSIEEMIGKTYRDLSPETADLAEPVLKKLMERGRPVRNLETRAIPPADPGIEHIFLLSMDPMLNARGEVIGQISAVQDVTDLRRAEEESARRLQELEILYAHAQVGICHVNAELQIVQPNDLFARMTGRPVGELCCVPIAEALPETIAAQVEPRFQAVLRGGDPETIPEVRGSLPGMEDVEFAWSVVLHPVKSGAGDITDIVSVWQDVTGLIRRQRETAAVRDRLAEAQRMCHIGSWEWNLIEDKVWWSPELYEIFGEELHYEPSYLEFFEHIHQGDRRKVREQIERTLAEDQPYRITYRVVRPDGSERLVFTTAMVERTADGTAARLVGTCQDVTDRAFRPVVGRRRAR